MQDTRPSSMSGRTSQDTVDSQTDYNGDESEEGQIIQPPRQPAPVQRRRVRCLFPMLVAVFLVLVGVIATPLVVFIANGTAGELPFVGRFFGGKNDTAVGNLSLASVTQAAPVGGESVSPPDSPGANKDPQSAVKLQGGNRKDLRPPTRPPSGMGKGAHGPPAHHSDNSNRERVYAPGVGTASTTTKTPMDLVEVQALTEQVIVVPKGGVMSKLRVAAVTDDEEKPKGHVPGRHRMPVRAAGVQSAAGRRKAAANGAVQQRPTSAPVGLTSVNGNNGSRNSGTRRANKTAGVASVASPPKLRGRATANGGGQQKSPSAPVGLTKVGENNGTRRGSVVIATVTTRSRPRTAAPLANDSTLAPSHSLKKRHSWAGHRKKHRRMRRKKPLKGDSGTTRRNGSRHATKARASVTARHYTATGRHSNGENETAGPAELKRNTGGLLKLTKADSNSLALREQAKLHLSKAPFQPDNASFSTPKESNAVGNEVNVTIEQSNSSATGSTNFMPGSATLVEITEAMMSFTERAAAPNQTDVITESDEKVSNLSSKSGTPSNGSDDHNASAVTAVLVHMTTGELHRTKIEKATTLMNRESLVTSPQPSGGTSVHHQTHQEDVSESGGTEAGRFVDFKSHDNDTLEDSNAEERGDTSLTEVHQLDGSQVDKANATTGEMPVIHHTAAEFESNVSLSAASDDEVLNLSTMTGIFTSTSVKSAARKRNFEGEVSHFDIATVSKKESSGGSNPSSLSSPNETSYPENTSTTASTPSNVTHRSKVITGKRLRTTDYAISNATKPATPSNATKPATPSNATIPATPSAVTSDRSRLLEIEVKFPVPRKRKKILSLLKTSVRSSLTSTEKPLESTITSSRGQSVNETTASASKETHSASLAALKKSVSPLVAINSAADTTKVQPPTSSKASGTSTVHDQVTRDDNNPFDDDDDDDEESTTIALLSTQGLATGINDSLVIAERDSVMEPKSGGDTTVAATFRNAPGEPYGTREIITAGYNAAGTTSHTGGSNRSVETYGTRKNLLVGGGAAGTTNRVGGGDLRLEVSPNPENRSVATTLSSTLHTSTVAVSTADTTVATLPSVASPRVPQARSRPVKEATSQGPSEDHPSNVSINKTPAQPSTIISTTSSSSNGRARQGPLNNGTEEGWRTILPPKNPPTSTAVAASSDTGVGVEYYDDSKNDSVSDGNADATAGDSDTTLHKRRIGGEVDDSTNSSSKKSDVFQTEYYYDDVAPSSKPEESTKYDTTVAEYENAPEQDRIDDLFF